jgi:hypothetical protein
MNTRLWLLITMLCLSATVSQAAVTLDNVATGVTTSGTATGLTFSKTVGAGCANAVLYVIFFVDNLADTVTGVTYNAVALTQRLYNGGGTDVSIHVYRLLDASLPAKGSAWNVVISLSAGNGMAAGAISVCGAHQTTPERDLEATFDANGTDGFTTALADSAVGDLVIAAATGTSTTPCSFVWTGPATEQWDVIANHSAGGCVSGATVAGAPPTISASGTYTTAASTATNMAILSVQSPAVAAISRGQPIIFP